MAALYDIAGLLISSGISEEQKIQNQFLIQIAIDAEITQKMNTSDYQSDFESDFNSSLNSTF